MTNETGTFVKHNTYSLEISLVSPRISYSYWILTSSTKDGFLSSLSERTKIGLMTIKFDGSKIFFDQI